MPLERPVDGFYKTVSMEAVMKNGRIERFETLMGHYPPLVSVH